MRILLFILAFVIHLTGAFAQSEKEAYTAASNAIVRAKGANEKERLYQDMVTRFAQYRTTLSNNRRDLPVRAIAYAFIEEKDTAKADYYITQLIDIPTLPSQLYGMAKAAQRHSLNDYAEDLFKRTINSYERLDLKPDRSGDPLGLANNRDKYGVLFYTDYALLLTQNGKAQQGLDYAKKAYRVNENDKTAIATYAKLLSDKKMFAEALPVMEQAIRKGVADSNLQAAYKQACTSLHGEKSYQERLVALNKQQQRETFSVVRAQIISEAAPEFSLKDLDGKTWSLAELKGKTVVLDFWATWCAPCKKSFPAMQKAVSQYKADTSVVFLFIHTWERNSNAVEEAKKYISDNNYDFNVLMDSKNNGKNEIIGLYKAQGIPAKFVIDGEGNIRFKLTGFSGSDEHAVSELSAMIELARSSR